MKKQKNRVKLNGGRLSGHVSKPDLARMLGTSNINLHYHIKAKNIEDGNITIGKRSFYTKEKAAEILERVKGATLD